MNTKKTTRNHTKRLVGAGLVGATVLGSIAIGVATAAPASAASPVRAAASADVTRGFDIVNSTKHTLELTGVGSPGERDQYKPAGTTILPGQSYRYEKVYYFAKRGETTLTFNYREALDDGTIRIGSFDATIVVDAFSGTNIRTDAGAVFSVENQGITAGRLIVSEKEFSTITVPASDAQRQADLLNQTCVSGLASCSFAPQSKKEGAPQIKLVAGGANNTDLPRTESFTTKAVATTTSSVETTGSAKLTIKGILEAGLTHKYGGTWSDTREVTKVHNYTMGAFTNFNMWSRMLTERVTGDFTVTLGKTTWKLTGVSFDVPDMKADPLYDTSAPKLTEAEKAAMPKVAEIKPIAPIG